MLATNLILCTLRISDFSDWMLHRTLPAWGDHFVYLLSGIVPPVLYCTTVYCGGRLPKCFVLLLLAAGFKMEQDSGRFKATFEFQAPCFLK